MGGVSWERLPIDPKPGPRSAAEIVDGEEIAPGRAARRPGHAHASTASLFAESRMAGAARASRRCSSTPASGPRASRRAWSRRPPRSASTCSCSWTWAGTCSGAGSEPGLASPLCDAVMLAAGALLERARRHRGGRGVRPGLRRRADPGGAARPAGPARRGGRPARDRGPHARRRRRRRARGRRDTRPRRARRPCAARAASWASPRSAAAAARSQLTPFGASIVYFDPAGALDSAAPLAREVLDAADLSEAQERLHALGVRTELDYERTAG